MMIPILVAALSLTSPAPPTAGVVDSSLLEPYEWAQEGGAAPWRAPAYLQAYQEAGFDTRLLGARDLAPQGLAGLQVLVMPGDHVYPEQGRWGGPVLGAIAEFVRSGGVYVMAVGVPHYVARDLASGQRDSGHWGDLLGLEFEPSAGAAPLALTSQGRELGLPEPQQVAVGPVRALRGNQPAAVLAWDANYLPALVARRVGKGYVIYCGCGDKLDEAYARWWQGASARTALAALQGKLRLMSFAETLRSEKLEGVSLDDRDREAFQAGPSPLQSEAVSVALQRGAPRQPAGPPVLSLDGQWEMVGRDPGKGRERELLAEGPWPEGIPAPIPGSVHTALLAAGKIPDPTVGHNADLAHQASHREWWLRRRFDYPAGLGAARLCFEGVDYSCTVWLNGVRLGRHEGACGGPEFEVGDLLREHNTLVVRLDPVPEEWQLVLKTNVVYGWHYVNLPSLGIWQPVRLRGRPAVEMGDPFVATRDARGGVVDLCLTLRGRAPGWSGKLQGTVAPANFGGSALHFTHAVPAGAAEQELHLRFQVPNPQLWWPVDLGAPNLYRLELSFLPEQGAPDALATSFGIRTVQTRPLPEGAFPSRYQWTFVINGQPVFLKGANWCILDALLRLDAARYQRFLQLARSQHLQLLRAWGGGLVETDTFYDLCDRLGIMVYQEFPLTWQRFEVLSPSVVDETVSRSVRRLRNHPSLLMWGGGNEHAGKGPVIEQMGRLCLELDGSRPFHRTDPYGGSLHNYDVYWGRQPLERNLSLAAPFIGEFGLSSPPNLESVQRYLPPAERSAWPPPEGGAFIRHTPTYSQQHLEIMQPYAAQFAKTDTMASFITGMQLAQATGVRHTLELARTRWPEATGACYYKLTDVYPGCAWASVDWYGVPKIAYYFIQDAYQPLHACALFDHLAVPAGVSLAAPVYLLDDAGQLKGGWTVAARALDGLLRPLARAEFRGSGPVGRVKRLGELVVPAAQAQASPLLVVTEVRVGKQLRARTFYWLNFAARPGCLFKLPNTRLQLQAKQGRLVVKNVGRYPAVGVHFPVPAISDRFSVEDAYFWLEAGEQRTLAASHTQGVAVQAWNARRENL